MTNLAHDFDRFRSFAPAADAADAGESAAREHLGISLGDMMGALLGEGDWMPQPERWADPVKCLDALRTSAEPRRAGGVDPAGRFGAQPVARP